MMDNHAFAGSNGFVWWIGVVENRMDPLNLCRCKIRIFGWHTENKQHIPTDHLPWAQPILPPNNSHQSKTPYEGDWVFGFFLDGDSGQVPIYLGVFPSIPSPYTNNVNDGFTDARSASDLSGAPSPHGETAKRNPKTPGEPTTSRLYRNEKIAETLIGKRKETLTKDVKTAKGSTWNEPTPPYDTKPPYNDVKETESGHLLEFDDTPKAERINIAHRTSTYIEMQPNGSMTTRITKDNYEIVIGDNYVNIKGTCNITINGDANLLVNGDTNLSVDGDTNISVDGDTNLKVKGSFNAIAKEFNFDGPINQTNGDFTNEDDVIASDISLVKHIHEDDDNNLHVVTGPPVK